MKRDFLEDLKNNKYSKRDSIADLVPYLLEGIPYALAVNSSAKLRTFFAAAIIKYKNSDKDYEDIVENIDINKYSDEKSISKEEVIIFLITNAIDLSNNLLIDLCKILERNGHKLNCGESCFFYSMSRLKESFKGAAILLKSGFFVEVIPICRLIYEQLCWACFVIDEHDYNAIEKSRTTKNTKFLKNKINEQYGSLYDDLSKEAHLAPNKIGKYLHFDNSTTTVRGRSGKKCEEEVSYLILLYRIYIEVIQYSITKHFTLENDDRKYYNDFINCQLYTCVQLSRSYYEKDGEFMINIGL